MKIAFLGAPHSGKSLTARRVVRRLNEDHQKSWTTIDGYVENLSKRTGQSFLSSTSDLHEHLQIMAERWTLESEAAHKGLHTITCGSIYESIIYAAMPGVVPGTEQEMLAEHTYYQVMMSTFGMLEQRTFDYTALFYLPWQNPSAEQEHSWDGVLNQKIPEVLEGYFKYAIVLDGTDRQRVDRATDLIRYLLQAQTPANDEPSV